MDDRWPDLAMIFSPIKELCNLLGSVTPVQRVVQAIICSIASSTERVAGNGLQSEPKHSGANSMHLVAALNAIEKLIWVQF